MLRYGALAAAALLLMVGLFHILYQDDVSQADGSSAALGLMLLNKEQGIYVLAVTQDSLADRAGVLPGDYLLRVNDVPLADADQFDAFVREEDDVLQMVLRRDGRELLVRIPTH